jgi:hypothetical protein
LGPTKGSLFSLSTKLISRIVVGLKPSLGAHVDVVYTVYKTGRYDYDRDTSAQHTADGEAVDRKTMDGEADDRDADDMDAVERGTVDREIFFETYPFLWTLLVLF